MYLISLYFDEVSNRKITAWMNEIAEKTGNRFMTEHRVPPHLTVSAFEIRDEEKAIDAFARVVERTEEFDLRIVSVGAFFPYVLYAEAVQSRELFALSHALFYEIGALPDVKYNKRYKPFSWIPHLTLGKMLSDEQMKIAFELMQQKFAPFTVTVGKIGIAKPKPHRDIRVYEIAKQLRVHE